MQFEAIAISEVLALAEQYPAAATIIRAEIEAERTKVIQQHHPTAYLKASTTVKDILLELNLKGATIN